MTKVTRLYKATAKQYAENTPKGIHFTSFRFRSPEGGEGLNRLTRLQVKGGRGGTFVFIIRIRDQTANLPMST